MQASLLLFIPVLVHLAPESFSACRDGLPDGAGTGRAAAVLCALGPDARSGEGQAGPGDDEEPPVEGGEPTAPDNAVTISETVVLAVGGPPYKVLVARAADDGRILLHVVDESLRVVEAEALSMRPQGGVAFFEQEKVPVVARVERLIDRHKLARVAPRDLDPAGRAMVFLEYGDNDVSVQLLTAAGTRTVKSFPADTRLNLRFYFDDKGGLLLVAGKADRGEVLELVRLDTSGAEKLSQDAVAAAFQKEVEQMVDREQYAPALPRLRQWVARTHSEEATYLACLVFAYLQLWEESAGYLKELRGLTSESGKAFARQAWATPVVREAWLRGLDINGDDSITFKANKGFEGTSVWVKVKDASGKTIASFKPSNSNTYHRGEAFTYQMGKLLGIEELYPVTFVYELDAAGCEKFVAALKDVSYKGFKEKNRKKLIDMCRKGGIEGAVKEWVPDFVFFGAIGTVARLQKHSVYSYLQRQNARPEAGKTMSVSQTTHIYKPDQCKEATYVGTMDVAQLARDLSDVLVVDVLNANEDRFPGANIEFKSIHGAKAVKECTFDFGESRLFSLDNGATFKGTYSNGYIYFTKQLKVTRFRKQTYQRLKAMSDFVNGETAAPDFLRRWGIGTVEDLTAFLYLDKGDSHKRRKVPFKLFQQNLKNVLTYMGKYVNDRFAWF